MKAAQRLGFTLAETVEVMRVTRRRGGSDVEGLRGQIEAKAREIEERIRSLELMRCGLQAVSAAECDSPADCGCDGECPIDADAPVSAVRHMQGAPG